MQSRVSGPECSIVTLLKPQRRATKNEIKVINKQYQQQLLANKAEPSSQGIFFFAQQDVIVLIIL